MRKYDAVVQVGKIGRTVQYESKYRKGSRPNLFALIHAYEKKYGEVWNWSDGIVIHEINLVK